MASVPLLLGASQRSLMPHAVLLNAVIEKAPTQQEQRFVIRARSGLSAFKTVGTGRARALFAKSGLFGDRALILSDSTVYTLAASGVVTTLSGSLPGSDLVDIDAGQDADLNSVARVATGSALYKVTEAGGVVPEDFPAAGGAGASSVCFHRGFWLATEAGTDQVYYQVPGDTAWDALSFASAEFAPDPLKGVRSRGDQIVLLGSQTTEVWTLTGEASPAIAPYGGLNFDYGCRSIRTAVSCAGSLIWVDDQSVVRKFDGGEPVVISDEGLVEQIKQIADGDLAASFKQDGIHGQYVLRLGAEATWAYDLNQGSWATRNSLGYDYWRALLFASLGGVTIASDSASTQIYTVDADASDDAGSDFAMEFMAYVELPEGQLPCANLELICATGFAPRTGQGSNPVAQMRMSDDGGLSWGSWKERPLGLTGQTSQRVRWNGLGQIKGPHGRWFHFRISDPVGRRISDVRMNAP